MPEVMENDDGEPTANIQKNFWGYIKVAKKDRVGTAPLKNNNVLFSNPKSKADQALERWYQGTPMHG